MLSPSSFLKSNRFKEAEKTELELQNRQAELEYLKSQINPHFLFNNLNSIYSLIYHKSDKALKAVEQLSSLLRYMLYEKNKEVLLTEEVDYLKNFIALQKKLAPIIRKLIKNGRTKEYYDFLSLNI